MDTLLSWFESQGGSLDSFSIKLADIEGHGRGAVAKRDIPEGHVLFSIPRGLTLSTRNSALPGLIGQALWDKHGLGKGWVGLILCMMWEEAQGTSSKWSGYLNILPNVFDTPMFWAEEDLQELKATAVFDKIGKEDAERDYRDRLLPCLQTRPDLFPQDQISTYYSLERYHINGSRILSRSFHVENAADEEEEDNVGDTNENGMDVDEAPQLIDPNAPTTTGSEYPEAEDSEASEDEDEEDVGDVAMVPLADMLNARYGSENAKLFYEKHDLRMVTTKPIKAGEQIWNTYGDPPNSDLLRRYGHVDIIPLPEGGEGNPADIVEVRADLVVECLSGIQSGETSERIDWWLDQGGDDVFVLDKELELPEDCISFIRLLQLPQNEWEKARKKNKLPKGKLDPTIASIGLKVLDQRLNQYPTTIEEDEGLLSPERIGGLSLNRKHAVIVRLGEKRILKGTLDKLRSMAPQGGGKRKANDTSGRGVSGKKSRR